MHQHRRKQDRPERERQMPNGTPEREAHGSMTPHTAEGFLRDATARLAEAGIEAPRREARLLLAHVLGVDPQALLLRVDERPLPSDAVEAASTLVGRRAAREPLAFLTGRQGFWTLDLAVSDATLIPRADSETLIEAVLASRPDRSSLRRVLDLGTGTGCLLLAALSEYPGAWGLGLDLSPGACRLARGNADRNGLGERMAAMCGRWGEALALPAESRFDLVLSNPPYIPSRDIADLMPEVARFEPRRALDGGDDGLNAYRQILPALPGLLAPGGLAVLEVGQGQAEAMPGLAAVAGLRVLAVRPDLGGIPRAVVLERS
jgi:release factor glutamine methyltransferase